MRERISEPMSDYYKNEVELPLLLDDYDHLLIEELLVQRAYAVMLTKAGILSTKEGKKIIEGLEYVKTNLKREDLNIDNEDLYFNVQHCLVEKIGIEIGGKLHMGRSRNDIGSTLNRMIVRKTILSVTEDLIALQEELLRKAREEQDVIMTGYTHTQPAQPTCMGHYYTAIFSALIRDFERLKAAFQNTNRSPYGTAASLGATFPIDRELLAGLLGFDDVLENSLDCIASKDFLIEAETSYVNMGITLSRFAQDLYVWSTYEFGLLEFGGQVAVCSSIMPQKKNASGIEYAKSKVAHPIGSLVSTLCTLKNIPFTNCIDIHEALWYYRSGVTEIKKVLGVLKECLKYSHINKERAYKAASENFCTVTALADYLVKTFGISFDQAHHIVGEMVGEATEKSEGIAGMTPELLERVSKAYIGRPFKMSNLEMKNVLDPYYNVQSKVTYGGPQKTSVTHMIQKADENLQNEKAWITQQKEKIEECYRKLEEEERKIINA
ncbi:MAG: argininosuccinate lyase [Clostridia bacterium]